MGIEIIRIFEKFWYDLLKILPSLIISIIILMIFFLMANNISKLARKRLFRKTDDILLSTFLGRISKWIFLIIGFVIAMEVLGLTALASGILTGAGISAIILGLAFKNIGENFLSGLLLAFNRPFKVGDLIMTSGFTGTIAAMDFRTTSIKTAEGQEVFIPNSLIINNPLTNFTKDGLRRFEFSIQLDYGNNIDKAKEIITNSINKVTEVLKDPAPLVVIDQLTSNVILKAYYWIDALKTERTLLEIKSDVIELSKKDLLNEGIIFSDLTQIKILNETSPLNINTLKK